MIDKDEMIKQLEEEIQRLHYRIEELEEDYQVLRDRKENKNE